jgi:DNA-binding GntR family transcriptional regulator
VSIDHDDATPVYQQLARILRDRIASGELSRRVPSSRTLSQEYGVSHITAEKAVKVLRDEGLVRAVVGRGVFVIPPGERRA